MNRNKVLFLLVLLYIISPACTSPNTTEPSNTSPVIENEDTILIEVEQPSPSLPIETTIRIDGNPSDWEDYEILLTDDEGDNTGGGIDIAAVRAFTNDTFLYVLAESTQPPSDYVQVDLDIFAGGKNFIITFQPQNLSSGHMGDVTGGDYIEIGEITGSFSAASKAVEFKVPLSAFENATDIRLGIRPMGGECCELPDWYVIDQIGQTSVPAVDEIEPKQDLTLPPPNSGQALVVEQTQADLHCDEPSDIVTNPNSTMAYISCRNVDMIYAIDLTSDQVVNTLSLRDAVSHPFGAAPGQLAITPDGSMVLVANELDRSVSLVDTATFTVTTTIPMDMSPAQLAAAPDGKSAYVVGHESGKVTVLDLVNERLLKTIPLPGLNGPYGVAFAPDGSAAYAAAMDGGLSIIDPSTQQVIGHIDLPHAGWRGDLIINSDGTTGYLASVESNWIMEIDLIERKTARTFNVQKPQSLLLREDECLLTFGTFGSYLQIPPVASIDLNSGEMIDPIMFNSPAPHVSWTVDIQGLAFDSDGSHIYAPSIDADGIFVIDAVAKKQSAFLPLTEFAVRQPEKLIINSDGSTLYTANVAPQAPSISIVDTASGQVDTQFYLDTNDPCFSQATSIALSPDDRTIYVSTSNCLILFNTASSSFTDSIPINISNGTIRDLEISPDGNSIYLIDSAGVVSVVDRTSLDVIDTVQAVEEGHNLKISPDGTRVYVTGSRQYAVIDTATNAVIASDTIRVGGSEQFNSYPDRLIGIPPGHEFYTIGDFFYMLVYDAATNKLLREINLESWAPGRTLASDAIFSPDGSAGYLALWDLKGVVAFDPSTWELTAQIDTGTAPIFGICPNDFAFHPNGKYLYLSCEQSDNIMVIDTTINEVIDVIQLVP